MILFKNVFPYFLNGEKFIIVESLYDHTLYSSIQGFHGLIYYFDA